ncbi:unnamed protein product [Blepharisma stoltei]|uniref:Uncharacterized protein n=1 Tax=Blepharisma stoltei TaxID=1481888 RepID=A0AAU9K6G3_9CILI|nr:unnamed protein product [Blepharisma stoltei]
MLMGTSEDGLCLYDFYTNSYSKIAVFDNIKRHFLISGKTNAYIMASQSDIYESGFKNPHIWSRIAISVWNQNSNFFVDISQ